ncbi:hypothetical protein [Flavobacterium sp.]|uniref:hypothetical protein n=1 Tax=Flavobacterium sp. TaxID=239 RepID=UPI0008B0BDD0|nr:hypothetical protein [Flavobacterium sp.]OGS61238.1 MAG: hypothetical protein A2X07_06275 [Flavobacteria bacterium GWF1_32_7]HBD27029.1 hypothetical protein [Flavobacterium sp.]
MKKFLFLIVLVSTSAIGQVLSNQPVVNQITDQNPFLDASTSFNGPGSIGKGLVFPQTDLTAWTFDTSGLDGINFPSAFDGMIVYNTASGSTLENQGQIVSVTPGFYYFSNPGATDNIANGQWRKMGSGLGLSDWSAIGSRNYTIPGTSIPAKTDSITNTLGNNRRIQIRDTERLDTNAKNASFDVSADKSTGEKMSSSNLNGNGSLLLHRFSTVNDSPHLMGYIDANDETRDGYIRQSFFNYQNGTNVANRALGYGVEFFGVASNGFNLKINNKQFQASNGSFNISADTLSGFSVSGGKFVNGNTIGKYKYAKFITRTGLSGTGSLAELAVSINRDVDGENWQGSTIRLEKTIDNSTSMGFIDFGLADGNLDTDQSLGFGVANTTTMVLRRSNSDPKVGIGTLNPQAKLDVNGYIKLGSADTTGDAAPQAGMLRFNTTNNKFQGYDGTTWVNLN